MKPDARHLLQPADLPAVSAQEPVWYREAKAFWIWAPPLSLIASLRAYERASAGRGPLARLARGLAVLRHRFWSVVTGADVPLGTRLGGGLLMPHPNGIVVHPDVVVGPNCLLMQQVTIGSDGRRPGVPVLGGHVDVGAGAKLLGPCVIGDHATIGANAVVLCDVPAGCTAVGIPARILRPADVPAGADR